MAKAKARKNTDVINHIDSLDAEAVAQCDEIVEAILKDVQANSDRDAQRLTSQFAAFKEFHNLPYDEMLEKIADQMMGGKRPAKGAARPPAPAAHSPKNLVAPRTCVARTVRTRAGKRQVIGGPAPTPAVAALNDVGYNVTSVRNFHMEVDLPDGTKRTLTREDFESMNPDDMHGTALERLLTEALRMRQLQ